MVDTRRGVYLMEGALVVTEDMIVGWHSFPSLLFACGLRVFTMIHEIFMRSTILMFITAMGLF